MVQQGPLARYFLLCKISTTYSQEDNMKKVVSVLLAGAMAFSFFTSCSKKNVKATSIAIAIQPSFAFVPVYVAKEMGYLEDAFAKSQIEVKWNDFESGPPINESLAAGSSDIGLLGDVPTVSAIAAGQENELIALACDGPDAYVLLVAANNNSVKTMEDLRGKKVATTLGSTGHNMIKKLLEDNKMTFDDIELTNISAGDAGIVLSTGDVEAVAIWEPNATRLIDEGTAKAVFYGSDTSLMGTNALVARAEYSKNNPEIITTFLEQIVKAVKDIEADSVPEEVWSKIGAYLRLSNDQIKKLLPKYYYGIKWRDVSKDALQDTIGFLVSIGRLDEEYQIRDYINESYYDAIKNK